MEIKGYDAWVATPPADAGGGTHATCEQCRDGFEPSSVIRTDDGAAVCSRLCEQRWAIEHFDAKTPDECLALMILVSEMFEDYRLTFTLRDRQITGAILDEVDEQALTFMFRRDASALPRVVAIQHISGLSVERTAA